MKCLGPGTLSSSSRYLRTLSVWQAHPAAGGWDAEQAGPVGLGLPLPCSTCTSVMRPVCTLLYPCEGVRRQRSRNKVCFLQWLFSHWALLEWREKWKTYFHGGRWEERQPPLCPERQGHGLAAATGQTPQHVAFLPSQVGRRGPISPGKVQGDTWTSCGLKAESYRQTGLETIHLDFATAKMGPSSLFLSTRARGEAPPGWDRRLPGSHPRQRGAHFPPSGLPPALPPSFPPSLPPFLPIKLHI